MKEWLIDEIKYYIENEINYIESDIACNCGDIRDLARDLSRLNNLTDKEIEKIADKIVDDEYLSEFINNTIHEQLYS